MRAAKTTPTKMTAKTMAVPKSGCIMTRVKGTAKMIPACSTSQKLLKWPRRSYASETNFERATSSTTLPSSEGWNAREVPILNQPNTPRVFTLTTSSSPSSMQIRI